MCQFLAVALKDMKFLPVEKILKNGTVVTIRQATKKDAEGLLQTVSRYMIDSDHLVTSIEEFNPTILDEKRWIETFNENRNSLLLIATHKKKIIGNINLNGETRKKTRHNAVLGIGILKEWRSIGLGEILMQCAIDWAKENLTLETLWLHVFATHFKAIGLYKKMGFEEVAVQQDFIKNDDNSYSDNLVMKLSVKTN